MKNLGGQQADTRVVIVGLGYVGLPLALSFHDAGLTVSGIDAFAGRVAELNAGSSPIDDISDARLKKALAAGFTVVAPGGPEIGEADAVFVCVPTPVTASKDPDLGPVLSAAATVAKALKRGQLIILQSTTFPGTTSGPFRDAL
jgi:UDP-N-acetyl-D-glucosamine dehydrogenase